MAKQNELPTLDSSFYESLFEAGKIAGKRGDHMITTSHLLAGVVQEQTEGNEDPTFSTPMDRLLGVGLTATGMLAAIRQYTVYEHDENITIVRLPNGNANVLDVPVSLRAAEAINLAIKYRRTHPSSTPETDKTNSLDLLGALLSQKDTNASEILRKSGVDVKYALPRVRTVADRIQSLGGQLFYGFSKIVPKE